MKNTILEIHRYSPEQNKVYIRGIPFRAKINALNGVTTIKEARQKLFTRIERPFIHAVIEKIFPAPYEYLNSVKSGRVESRKDVLEYIRKDNAKNRYGEFIDMSGNEYVDSYIMPTPEFKVTTRLVG